MPDAAKGPDPIPPSSCLTLHLIFARVMPPPALAHEKRASAPSLEET